MFYYNFPVCMHKYYIYIYKATFLKTFQHKVVQIHACIDLKHIATCIIMFARVSTTQYHSGKNVYFL